MNKFDKQVFLHFEAAMTQLHLPEGMQISVPLKQVLKKF